MPDFAYHAIDPEGREKRGRIAAANDDIARERLSQKKLYIVSVEPAASGVPVLANLPFRRRARLNSKQLTLFTRQLSSLVQVTPLEESLRTISRQSEQAHVRTILTEVHLGVVEGQRLSDAMRRESTSFPALYRAMIAAGGRRWDLAHDNRKASEFTRTAGGNAWQADRCACLSCGTLPCCDIGCHGVDGVRRATRC